MDRSDPDLLCLPHFSWGGCTVALVPGDRADDYIQKLKTEFYARRPNADSLDLDTVVFRTEPGDGAAIYV